MANEVSVQVVNALDPEIVNGVWPELANQQATISPPGNGMNRFTGELLQGWDDVEQSLELIFATPYHTRVLRRWVGSFVPAILGDNATLRTITRFFWAIATSIDLWEPRYRLKQIYVMGNALSDVSPSPLTPAAVEAMARAGDFIFREEGVYYPAGNLGNFTPYTQRAFGLTSKGGNLWDVVPVRNA